MVDTKPGLKTIMVISYSDNSQLYDATFDGRYNVVHAHNIAHAIARIEEEHIRPYLILYSEREKLFSEKEIRMGLIRDNEDIWGKIQRYNSRLELILWEDALPEPPNTMYALMLMEDPTKEDIDPGYMGVHGITKNTDLGVLRNWHWAGFKQPRDTDGLHKVVDFLTNNND